MHITDNSLQKYLFHVYEQGYVVEMSTVGAVH